jgi:hypothetical protein
MPLHKKQSAAAQMAPAACATQWVLVLAVCFALTGCGSTVRAYDVRSAGDEHSQWNSFFLAGAVGEADVDVDRVCGPGRRAAEMGIGHNFLTVALTIVSLGVYTPNIAYLTCGEAVSQASVQR